MPKTPRKKAAPRPKPRPVTNFGFVIDVEVRDQFQQIARDRGHTNTMELYYALERHFVEAGRPWPLRSRL